MNATEQLNQILRVQAEIKALIEKGVESDLTPPVENLLKIAQAGVERAQLLAENDPLATVPMVVEEGLWQVGRHLEHFKLVSARFSLSLSNSMRTSPPGNRFALYIELPGLQ